MLEHKNGNLCTEFGNIQSFKIFNLLDINEYYIFNYCDFYARIYKLLNLKATQAMYDDILFFVSVVAYDKFSVAAEKLGISQSTISRKIAALEQQLNFKLIKRDSRNLELTEYGTNLAAAFHEIDAEVEAMLSGALLKNKRYNNVINILLPVGMANYGFSRSLVTINDKLEGIDLNLTYYAGTVDIDKYNYDLAVASQASKKEYHAATLIYSSKVIIVCSQEYIQKYGLCSTIEDLSNHMVVGNVRVLEENMIPQLFRESDSEITQLLVDYKLYLNSFIEAKNLVMSGLVISGLLEDDVKEELKSGKIVRVLPDYHVGYMNYYLVSKFKSDDVRYTTVLELLEDSFKKY